MILHMADGEIANPQADDEPVPMEEVADMIFADPEPVDDKKKHEAMAPDVDEEGEVTKVGSDEDLDP